MCGEESPQLHLLSVLYLFNLYATPFSSLSSFKLSQIIDENLNTNSDKPDFDLQLLVHQIDTLLVDYNNQLRKRNPNREKLASVQANLASASDASNLREQASFFFQTNRYPDGMLRRSTPDKHSSVEWYWKYSLGCSKVFNSGRRWKDLKGCTKPQWMADGQDLQQHSRVIYYMCMIFHLQINTSALEGIQSNLVASLQPRPILHHDAVGIKEKLEKSFNSSIGRMIPQQQQ
ncbi:uncharacterized protein LOC131027076 isoform X1 [Cryptomeria japonica]|uniref:uncharacterized protein LOC131027076 isoform X1 n=1 Tax=Cryptomeria japonica TaxID=3369 RepID=UPI0027DA37D3|nr:uncharacterized protein LOC131027076 isoform X1 [Cryptomeria japonica]